MLDTQKYLTLVRRRGDAGLELSRVYRNMRRQELFLLAYAHLYANKGAMTPGIAPEGTVDGMSLERIDRLIDRRATGTYTWTPVRRTYIEKSHSRTMRPLGMPGWNDKMVQDVMRMILEAYYEPQFRDCSHGFRPTRGCHTALRDVYYTWAGVKWFLKLDIKGCFDNIDHAVLLDILRRQIKDERFLKLIKDMLEAGYMEEWTYHATYSGTPQGGILSPLLTNVVLNELDTFLEDSLIPEYTRGTRRQGNPEYYYWVNKARAAKKRGDRAGYREAKTQQLKTPAYRTDDPNFARLWYVRYADDSLLGWTGTKADADIIHTRTRTYLAERLHLDTSGDKTQITNAREEKVRFLNYDIGTNWQDSVHKNVNGNMKRTINGGIRLEVPDEVVKTWTKRVQCGKTTIHRKEYINNSDYDIVMAYNMHVQGLINYYTLAHDVVKKMGFIRYVYEQSLAKTLALKHNTSVTTIYRRYRGYTAEGKRVIMVTVARPEKPPLVASYGKIPIRQNRKAVIHDVKPLARTQRTELLERLLNNTCEVCGHVGDVVGHHIKKLKDLKKKGRELLWWQKMMVALHRKTLFVCKECHLKIHGGQYDGRKLT